MSCLDVIFPEGVLTIDGRVPLGVGFFGAVESKMVGTALLYYLRSTLNKGPTI